MFTAFLDPPPGSSFRQEAEPPPSSAAPLLMALLIASLAMGLGALLVFYFVMRARLPQWPPAGTPPLPAGLWVSTALLLAVSAALHAAVRAARRDRAAAVRRLTRAALGLAAGFLISQTAVWFTAFLRQMPPHLNMYAISFYLLSGLHALHVIGGLLPLGLVTARAAQGRYTAGEHAGLRYCALYWHFVDIVWLIMFAALHMTR